MTAPAFTCPRCGRTTSLPSDVAAGYCPACRWWTGDSLLGSEDVMAQARIDGPAHLMLGPHVFTDEQRARIVARIAEMSRQTGVSMAQFAEAVNRVRETLLRTSDAFARLGRAARPIGVPPRKPRQGPWKIAR